MTIPTPSYPTPSPHLPPERPSFLRRNRSVLLIGVVVVLAGLGAGAALAAGRSGGSASGAPSSVVGASSPAPGSAAAGAPVSASSSAAPRSGSAAGTGKPVKTRGVRGVIVSESGSLWTVRTAKGRSVTVTITASTRFGTKKIPATAAQFRVGQQVAVLGSTGATGVVATRVTAPQTAAIGTAAPTTGSTESTPPPTTTPTA
jgi:hypothetical protein